MMKRVGYDGSMREVWGIIRGLLPIVMVVALARISVAQDLFSLISRPIVIGILGLFHVSVANTGDTMRVGKLDIPWTSDCAGLNLLVLLLAVAIWLNRNEPFTLTHWLKILGMLPAAVIANVLRVFTLIGYRGIFYPAVETPQLHYFFGLVWLVPFALIAMPPSPRHLSARVFELIHVAAVIALLAPLSYGPGGVGMTLAVVLGLAHCELPEQISKYRLIALVAWLFAGGLFAFAGMESFWLPWLIVCPLISDARWIFSIEGAILTLSTHPLFALLPGAELITWVAIAFVVWKRFLVNQPYTRSTVSRQCWTWRERCLLTGVSILFLLPFLASTLFAAKTETLVPPKIAVSKPVSGDGFSIIMPGQPEGMGLVWYNPSGMHRHHALKICLKYRGVEIEQSRDDPDVFTDGFHWFREFFLQGGKLLPSHLQYVISTMKPGSSAGIHLIYIADSTAMSAKEFNQKAREMASELYLTISEEQKSDLSHQPHQQ